MRGIAISGLVALAVALGGGAVPATAMAQSAAAVRPGLTARPADVALVDSGLPAVSCVLATDCLGIEGSATQSGQSAIPARVARWNGSSWKRLGVALPKGATAADLDAVSCRGAKSCLVVGDYYTPPSFSGTSHVLALSYNGISLKPMPAVPLPKGATDGALSGVSCVTTRYCVAIGVADGATPAFGAVGSVIIIETWNGARWTLRTSAESIGKTTILVPSVVSCATATRCVLAGDAFSFSPTTDTDKPYVASWNGKQLTTMKLAAVGRAADAVVATGVSCATASNCAVTGADLGRPSTSATSSTAFTEIWNGKSWQLAKVTWPKGVASTFTTGVSCYGAHSCEAVGEDAANAEMSPADAAAVSFDGTAGTVQAVPAPSKGHSNALAAVGCLPWGDCVAIGQTGKTTATTAALMTGVWNGRTWKLYPGF